MNIWEHPQLIATEALTHLEDALIITRQCAVDKTGEFSSKANGWKKGDTITYRTHGDYEAKDFDGSIDIQNIQSSSRSMVIEKHLDISVEVSAREEAMDLDSFSEQVIAPAAYRLAEKCEYYVAGKALNGAGLYVSTGLFSDAADIAKARKAATMQQLNPNRFCLVNLELEATLLGQSWFNQSQTRGAAGEQTLATGDMNRVMGMSFLSALTFPELTHEAGTGVSTTGTTSGTVNNIGNRVLTIAALTGAVKAGDRLLVAGLRRPLIAAADAAALATSVLLVDPITEIIKTASAVTTVASGLTYDINGAIFDSKSLAVSFPMLDMPGDRVTATAHNNGVSCRIVKGYDLQTKKTTMSLDLLCGAFAYDPRKITLLGQTV